MTLSFDKKQLVNWQYLTNDYYMNPNRELGKGAFGSVYEGYSFSLNRLIAVKKVEVEINSDREIKILAELSSLIHPNIMGYYGHQINGPFLYIFIEYCPNGTLDDHIKSGLKQIEVLRMFRGLIEGMCYMNAKSKLSVI
jgi:mitogen-activated protein kinase kinase kinase 4